MKPRNLKPFKFTLKLNLSESKSVTFSESIKKDDTFLCFEVHKIQFKYTQQDPSWWGWSRRCLKGADERSEMAKACTWPFSILVKHSIASAGRCCCETVPLPGSDSPINAHLHKTSPTYAQAVAREGEQILVASPVVISSTTWYCWRWATAWRPHLTPTVVCALETVGRDQARVSSGPLVCAALNSCRTIVQLGQDKPYRGPIVGRVRTCSTKAIPVAWLTKAKHERRRCKNHEESWSATRPIVFVAVSVTDEIVSGRQANSLSRRTYRTTLAHSALCFFVSLHAFRTNIWTVENGAQLSAVINVGVLTFYSCFRCNLFKFSLIF